MFFRSALFSYRKVIYSGLITILFILLMGLTSPSVAFAQTFTVCPSGCDYTTIQAAIDAATSGDTIAIGDGTYTENLTISKDLILQGAGQGSTIVDGGATGTVVWINGAVTVELRELTIQNGFNFNGGGIVNQHGTLTLTNSTLSGNMASNNGGGIVNQQGTLTLTNSTLSGNSATYGGGIYTDFGSTATVTDSTLSANSATRGGGIYTALGSTATVTNSTLSANSAPHGGGIYINNLSTATVTNSTLSGNMASNRGGGIYNFRGTLTVTGSTLSDNSAIYYGGGIYNWGFGGLDFGSTVTVTNSTLSNNSATSVGGGGIYNYLSTLTLTNSTLSANSTTKDGGGIYNYDSTATVTSSTLSGNSATEDGGGIYNYGSGFHDYGSTLTLTNSTLSANSTASRGGGIYNYGSTATVTNSTLSGNSATLVGGGIYNIDNIGGGGEHDLPGVLTVANTIVVNSTSGGNCSNNGTFNATASMDDDGMCPGFTQVTLADLHLGALEGDPAYFPLLLGSVAIDAGDNSVCPTTDQRGEPRPSPPDGQCDVGAFEYQWNPGEFLISQLMVDVQNMNLQTGIGNSLNAKLSAAQQALQDANAPNDVAAINALNAFINAVEAQRGKALTDTQADELIQQAQAIIDALS